MSTLPKINIKERVFNLGNNETFLLEYPSNYEEIVNKKISKLQEEYESVSNNVINKNINIDNHQNEIKSEKTNKELIEMNNNNNLIDNKNENNYYYEPIGNIEVFSIGYEINENNDNTNNNIQLEPNEGKIDIKKIQKEKINCNENQKVNEKEEDEINNEEFYEVEEKEIPDNNKNEKNKIEKNEKNINKNNLSPVKYPENIKLSMKLLNFKAPKWAENLTDKDFINMAKNIISSKKNIP